MFFVLYLFYFHPRTHSVINIILSVIMFPVVIFYEAQFVTICDSCESKKMTRFSSVTRLPEDIEVGDAVIWLIANLRNGLYVLQTCELAKIIITRYLYR